MLSLWVSKHHFLDNSIYLVKYFLESDIFMRCINFGRGYFAGNCEKGKCEGVLRLEYRNGITHLQCFLKYFCGSCSLLKWSSYDTKETCFWEECSWGTSVDVLYHHRNGCNGALFFLFLSVFCSLLLFVAMIYLIKNKLINQCIPHFFLPLPTVFFFFWTPLYILYILSYNM